MDNKQKIIVKRVKELLTLNKWAQADLAYKAGITEQTITNIMNYKTNPNKATLEQIASAFNVFPEYLTNDIPYKNYKDWKNKNIACRLSDNQLQAILNVLIAWGYEIKETSNNFITIIKPNGTETKLYIKHLSNISDTFITLLDNSLLPAELFYNHPPA